MPPVDLSWSTRTAALDPPVFPSTTIRTATQLLQPLEFAPTRLNDARGALKKFQPARDFENDATF